MARRRKITRPQGDILRCMAENGGRAEIYSGARWSRFLPGRAHIFAQAMHCMLKNRWITSRGQNQPHTYVWTNAGREAYERGWHVPEVRRPHYLDEKPMPAEVR